MTLVEVYNSGNVQLIKILSEGASLFGALANFKKYSIALHEMWLKLSRENILFNTRVHIKNRMFIQKEFEPIMKCSEAKMISLQCMK